MPDGKGGTHPGLPGRVLLWAVYSIETQRIS